MAPQVVAAAQQRKLALQQLSQMQMAQQQHDQQLLLQQQQQQQVQLQQQQQSHGPVGHALPPQLLLQQGQYTPEDVQAAFGGLPEVRCMCVECVVCGVGVNADSRMHRMQM